MGCSNWMLELWALVLASVTYLRGSGRGARGGGRGGLMPNASDRHNARGSIAHLAELEGCNWLDMQHALCLL